MTNYKKVKTKKDVQTVDGKDGDDTKTFDFSVGQGF